MTATVETKNQQKGNANVDLATAPTVTAAARRGRIKMNECKNGASNHSC